MSRREQLTLADHVALGNHLRETFRVINHVFRTHTVKSPAHRAATRALAHLGRLRTVLDEEVFTLVSEASRELDPRDLVMHVYYGASLVPDDSQNNSRDMFAGWRADDGGLVSAGRSVEK